MGLISRSLRAISRAAYSHVPDAAQRSSLCAAEPGPILLKHENQLGPGSAAHHHSASQTRVNALLVLRCVRGTRGKMAGSDPGHFLHSCCSPHRGGAMPGGGGGSEVLLPVSNGVMRRTVTRRLMRLGPGVCSL